MFNKDNIYRIDFIDIIGDCEIEMIALFNITKISEEEVNKAIRIHKIGINENIIFITKKQYENVFIS